jgi:hypothetical protein
MRLASSTRSARSVGVQRGRLTPRRRMRSCWRRRAFSAMTAGRGRSPTSCALSPRPDRRVSLPRAGSAGVCEQGFARDGHRGGIGGSASRAPRRVQTPAARCP